MQRDDMRSTVVIGILAFALVPVLAADAGAQLLLEVDGVELHGRARLVMSGAGSCNVLETDTSYEEYKANHGAPMDIWRLDFSVRNGSGRWLDHLIARFEIDSEWPDCTNWSEPDAAQFSELRSDVHVHDHALLKWSGTLGRIQKTGRNVVAPNETLTDTEFFIVLRGDPEPRFSNWSMDFNFGSVNPPSGTPAADAAAQQAAPPATAEQETVFWQSIANSTNPAMFEAYLAQFPSGVFRALAEARLAELRAPADSVPGAAGSGAPADNLPEVAGWRRADAGGTPGSASRPAGGADAPPRPGEVFRECAACPEMVVMPGGGLALGRYEVTVGEYRAFASATGGGGDSCRRGGTWRDPGIAQTDRHPVTCVSWDDAQEYVSWLSRTTGATYRLPTEAEWERAAAGSQRGCNNERTGNRGTCPVGSHGPNAAGLSDMVGNLWEWTEDCWEGDCGRRVVRGGSWVTNAEFQRPGARDWFNTGLRFNVIGFRVARTPD